MRAYVIATLSLVVLAQGPISAQNIYPDPSFENSGVKGVARTGESAGYLKVGAMNHWASIGGELKVEPFATYRITQWVKGSVDKGSFVAPYCYHWDNYEWAFAVGRNIKTCEDWTETQLTFVSPHGAMFVHPLAYFDAANCEVWVDDIVVEMIAEPAETMAQIEAKQGRSRDENEILARWYVKQDNLEAAKALLPTTDGIARADIACLIAKNTEGADERRPFAVEMVAYGGPTWNDGLKRFDEITVGMSEDEKLQIAREAVVLNPALDRAGRSYRKIMERHMSLSGSLLTVAEATTALEPLRASMQSALDAIPPDSASAKELQIAMNSIDESAEELAAREASLGSCIVSIGGKPIARATHAILIPNQPTPQEQHAARDLRYHLELITGEALPIWAERDAETCIPLVVGRCEHIADLGAAIDFEGLGIEGIHIKTSGPSVILAGNKRGVLYATYTFLEDYLGCRWFAADCSKWPVDGTINVPEIDKRYIPPLEYRGTDYPSSRPADFAVRNKYNGNSHRPDEARGGKISYRGFVHTFNALVPTGKYFAEHPEYYSEINGNRIGPRHTQLCLTNPDVLAIAIESVRRWIQESPSATIISVSQNDWHNYCQCDKCRALAEKEGAQSGPLLHFVNAIADDIKDDYPHIIIDTLAYQYTRKPPKHVRPRDNVAIRLCSIECCFIHPLETDPFNATFADDIRGWNEICDRLHIWDYVINYAHTVCPFPNLYVLKPNINFFIDNGVTGIYEEACYYSKGSELQELRSYVMAKILWDPTYDTDKAIDEFCEGYYGPAARFVRQYIDLIHESTQKDPDLHVRIYTHPRDYVFPEVIAESRDLFDQAEEAVKDDATLLHRVQLARLPIMYAEITLATGGAFVQRGDELVAAEATDISALAERFEKIARAEGLTRIREGGPHRTLDAWLESLPRRAKKTQILRLRNPALELAILPEVGGRIWRVTDRQSGRELLRVAGKPTALQPTEGGYEEYSEGTHRSPGWNEAYAVKEKSDRAITLEADLRNGLRLTRRIELDAVAPLVRIVSTVTNISGVARGACIRVHPEFSVETTQKASVRILRKDGTWRVVDLANPEDPQAEKNLWLRGDDIPQGKWAVVDQQADLAIVNSVDPAQISHCLLNWNGAQARVNLELYSPEAKLAPGESITIAQTYEVTGASEE